MPYSHLKRWRIAAVLGVLLFWAGLGLGLADGTARVLDAVWAVLFPLLLWANLWRPGSPLLRNVERRRARELRQDDERP